jgi:peptide/nickel transport system ATP-binding protein
MKQAVISFADVAITYASGVEAVRGITFQINEGECFALVGESGSGKTTLARATLGLLPAQTKINGSIRVNGIELIDASPKSLRRLRGLVIGFVSQDPFNACNPLARVSNHVAEAWLAHGSRPPAGAVAEALETLGIENAERRSKQYPHQWSGGMLQRAAIAAASSRHPQLIVADEPTSALDTDRADATLFALRSTKASVLLISHDINLVRRHADRIAVCRNGRIVEIGDTETVLSNPHHPFTKALLSDSDYSNELSGLGINRTAEVVLKAEGLSRVYGHGENMIHAVLKADLRVRRGEIIGIYGPSGCGKSTLLRLLAAIEPPTTGTVSMGSELPENDAKKPRNGRREKRGCVMPIFQDPMSSLDARWSAWRTITEPLMAKHRSDRPSRAARREIARSYLEKVELEEIDLESRPDELSIGQCQRISIARALVAEPELIVADEPTSALDASVAASVLRLLTAASETGIAIVIVSHNQSLLHAFCHRVLSMNNGSLETA